MWRGSPDIRIKSGLNRSPVSATEETWGYLDGCRYVLHDRDTKFCASFRSVLAAGGVKTMALPARSPNLSAFAERWVRSAKVECLSKLEGPLSRTLAEFSAHYHANEIIRAKATSSFSRMLPIKPNSAATPLSVASGSEDCSSSMPRPHEFFDHTQNETIPDAYAREGVNCLGVGVEAENPRTSEDIEQFLLAQATIDLAAQRRSSRWFSQIQDSCLHLGRVPLRAWQIGHWQARINPQFPVGIKAF